MAEIIVAGVEGGGTNTFLTLMNTEGKVLSSVKGTGSNIWSVGYENCASIIAELMVQAKIAAKLHPDYKVKSLGLCISGIETDIVAQTLQDTIEKQVPGLAENYFISSDTRAPLAVVSDKGGVVLISGTGSNCLLRNPDGSGANCGGYGHLLGDEGSAFWIVVKGIKVCLDQIENFEDPPVHYSTKKLWEAAKEYFDLSETQDLIQVFYTKFEKDRIASFCLRISELAVADGDDLCKWLFEQAGKYLAKHIQAVYKRVDEKLKCGECCSIPDSECLKIVCVGSVWKSWDLLKGGFVKQLQDTRRAEIKNLCLVKTKADPSVGACYLAAQTAKLSNFIYHYNENYDTFFRYSV